MGKRHLGNYLSGKTGRQGNLCSGTNLASKTALHLANKNVHTARFGSETIFSLGLRFCKLIPDKIKHVLLLLACTKVKI